MMISVLNCEDAKETEARLVRMGLHCQRFGKDSVKELNHRSGDQVYMVPASALGSEEWPLLRIRLAQANRYYIVEGGGLNSATVVRAVRDGAYDVLLAEDPDERWDSAIRNVEETQRLWLQLYGGKALKSEDLILGQSPSIKALRQAIERLGPTGASVLILGESGVGKEHVANALHKTASGGPFVAVNCAAIPKELIEAEIFGAEKGAYTGSIKARPGLVEQAAGGTLFLDEIGELDFGLQPKLLRFLESRRARRVGGDSEYRVDLRVLSATNSNLEQEIADGRFRPDLYYRLSEVTLRVPPLRARLEDIPLFAMEFLRSAGERFGRHFESIEPELVRKFQGYEWPGNVRELKNAIDRLAILYDGPVMRSGWWDVPEEKPAIASTSGGEGAQTGRPPVQAVEPGMFPSRKQKFQMAKKLLRESGNDLTWVAAQLGVNPSTLYRWRRDKKI